MEPGEAVVRLQLPSADDAAGVRVLEAARTLRASPCGAHCQAAEVCQRAMAHDGCGAAGGFDPSGGCEKPGKYVGGSRSRGSGGNSMNTKATVPAAAPEAQESYIVREG